ncbi:MAG: ferrochelatase [Bacteroidales bacterium]|jgi:ferrochelatase|nr:ferrochelatase [Bacteroidales bacterium]
MFDNRSFSRIAVVLVNLGTPDAPTVRAVRHYLSEFLNDKRVMDLPWLFRKLLVNGIIVPFRAPKSRKAYERLWTPQGSPLLVNLLKVRDKLQKKLNERTPGKYEVIAAMRYGKPSLEKIIEDLCKRASGEKISGEREQGETEWTDKVRMETVQSETVRLEEDQLEGGPVEKIIIVPLFPQYASSTTGSVMAKVYEKISQYAVIPEVKCIKYFYDDPLFIKAFAARIREYEPQKWDHVLFSYHGLPLRHINKIHPSKDAGTCTCDKSMPAYGKYCYKAACYDTTRRIVAELGLAPEKYSVAFQSRFGKDWLSPYTDEQLIQMARRGVKKVLVVSPSFVADCLETTVEIGMDYSRKFIFAGGEKLQLVESLNDSDQWIRTLENMVISGGVLGERRKEL